jgi:polysaccharide biosynthesis protein VpsQ
MFGLKIRRAAVALSVFVLFLVGLTLLADTGHGRRLFALVSLIPGGDKAGHLVLYGILSFLINDVLRAAEVRLGRISLLKGSLIVMIVVTLEECSQLFFAARTFDLGDLGADFIGIWLFGKLAVRYLTFKRAKLKPALLTHEPGPANPGRHL